MGGLLAAARLLPAAYREGVLGLTDAERAQCEEIRLRRGRSATVLLRGRERRIAGGPVTEKDSGQ